MACSHVKPSVALTQQGNDAWSDGAFSFSSFCTFLLHSVGFPWLALGGINETLEYSSSLLSSHFDLYCTIVHVGGIIWRRVWLRLICTIHHPQTSMAQGERLPRNQPLFDQLFLNISSCRTIEAVVPFPACDIHYMCAPIPPLSSVDVCNAGFAAASCVSLNLLNETYVFQHT